MKKKTLFIAIFLLLLLLAMTVTILHNYRTKKQNLACFENHCFSFELAVTPVERRNGLMSRENLDFDKAMLFVFEREEKHPFWMKNTLIPLDIIWINESKEVVFISENTQPCKEDFCPTIKPTEDAKYVLEINGGISNKIGVVAGNKITIEYSK